MTRAVATHRSAAKAHWLLNERTYKCDERQERKCYKTSPKLSCSTYLQGVSDEAKSEIR